MKVAFPTNKGEKIARHASFCKSFLIVDTKTGEREMVDNPLKTEIKAVAVEKDKSAGRHLGSGRIISMILADAGVDLYVYLEAEDNFSFHLQREGMDVYATQEKVIETILEEIKTKENEMMNQIQESEFRGFGQGRGMGRGFGRRAGRGFGKGAGMGQGIGRTSGAGRGFGRGAGMRQRADISGDFDQDIGNNSMFGQGRGLGRRMGRGAGMGQGIGRAGGVGGRGMGRGFGNR